MEETKHIRIKDFDYPLPDDRIAKYPLPERDSSKLLVYRHGDVSEDIFSNIASYLQPGDLMVFNNTRVIQARLHFRKDTGALIEVFCLEPYSPADYAENFSATGSCQWLCMIGNLKKWKEGKLSKEICIDGRKIVLSVEKGEVKGTSHVVTFEWNDMSVSFAEILDAMGELPIPPYLNRETEESDKRTYQTVYSKIKGSVAAPTAGLHFTERVFASLQQRGVERAEVTLHVGAGTFKPVKSDEISGHEMHTEYISVNRNVLERLLAHGGKAVAVGTTSVRTLESLYYMGIAAGRNQDASEDELKVQQWTPYEEDSNVPVTVALQMLLDYMNRHEIETLHSATQIIIAPGYKYKVVKAMVTNFHQPKSTLLLLVSAFVDGDWRKIYDYALSHGFRFLSYGDSSIIIP